MKKIILILFVMAFCLSPLFAQNVGSPSSQSTPSLQKVVKHKRHHHRRRHHRRHRRRHHKKKVVVTVTDDRAVALDKQISLC